MRGRSPTFTQIPLDIVGSTVFGRYPKISIEQTFNMIISDNFLVPYAGYILAAAIVAQAEGRAIYTSNVFKKMIAVIGSVVYVISPNLSVTAIANLSTSTGDVFIDENNVSQIAICDKYKIYIYTYAGANEGKFTTPSLSFIPGYITYQNGRFLAPGLNTPTWYMSAVGDGNTWTGPTTFSTNLQTKPDTVVAVQRVPSRGNLLYVFGNTVTEIWQDVGAQLFPYQRNSTANIDYGCLNPATIAYNDSIVVWLAANEKSGPVIAYSTGGNFNKISTDGIDFKLAQLTNPSNSYGFLFRQDGHLIYQITFPDDNLTYIYDFNTNKFFSLSDNEMNAHIAKRISFFNDEYYFVSFTDGNLYNMSTSLTTYNGLEIPRVRICKNIRLPDTSRFSISNLTFTIEQGAQSNVYYDHQGTEIIVPQSVHLSISKNGGQSFSNILSKELNARGNFMNRLNFWNLGSANDFIPQFRFWGLSSFTASDGIASIFQ